MNSDFSMPPKDEMETRLTALLLGELTPEEAVEVSRMVRNDPELTALQAKLKRTIELVRESATSEAEKAAAAATPLKMSPGKREELLQRFKVIAPKELAPPSAQRVWLYVPASIAAALIGLLILAGLVIPQLTRRNASVLRIAAVGEEAKAAKLHWGFFKQKVAPLGKTLTVLSAEPAPASGDARVPAAAPAQHAVQQNLGLNVAKTSVKGSHTALYLPAGIENVDGEVIAPVVEAGERILIGGDTLGRNVSVVAKDGGLATVNDWAETPKPGGSPEPALGLRGPNARGGGQGSGARPGGGMMGGMGGRGGSMGNSATFAGVDLSSIDPSSPAGKRLGEMFREPMARYRPDSDRGGRRESSPGGAGGSGRSEEALRKPGVSTVARPSASTSAGALNYVVSDSLVSNPEGGRPASRPSEPFGAVVAPKSKMTPLPAEVAAVALQDGMEDLAKDRSTESLQRTSEGSAQSQRFYRARSSFDDFGAARVEPADSSAPASAKLAAPLEAKAGTVVARPMRPNPESRPESSDGSARVLSTTVTVADDMDLGVPSKQADLYFADKESKTRRAGAAGPAKAAEPPAAGSVRLNGLAADDFSVNGVPGNKPAAKPTAKPATPVLGDIPATGYLWSHSLNNEVAPEKKEAAAGKRVQLALPALAGETEQEGLQESPPALDVVLTGISPLGGTKKRLLAVEDRGVLRAEVTRSDLSQQKPQESEVRQLEEQPKPMPADKNEPAVKFMDGVDAPVPMLELRSVDGHVVRGTNLKVVASATARSIGAAGNYGFAVVTNSAPVQLRWAGKPELAKSDGSDKDAKLARTENQLARVVTELKADLAEARKRKATRDVDEKKDMMVPAQYEPLVIPIKHALAGDVQSVMGSLTSGGGGGSSVGATVGTMGGMSGGIGMAGAAGGMAGAAGGMAGAAGGMAGAAGGMARARSAFANRLQGIIRSSALGGGSGDTSAIGTAKIIADERSNTLLVFADKNDMQTITNIIGKLDVGMAQDVVGKLDVAVAKVVTPPLPVPQPEIQTTANPFSTFSLNVSDVSFKLAASSLEKNVMPDPSTVRSEEFVNAFDYHDNEPPPGVPVGFAWERTRYPFAHNRDLVRFALRTAARGREPGRPLNIVLLLDNSGSMERADRVSIIREALRVLVAQLQAQDKISVVTFARTARLWADGLPGDQAAAVEGAGNLTPEGGTNLEEAMNLAYQTAIRHFLSNGVNRVVLLTDGAANLGDVDPDSLKKKVEVHRKQGIALDCYGIGWEGYNDDLLETLSHNGDGRYGFVNSPEEASTEFAAQLAGALQVAAADVKVQVEFNPRRVSAYRQIGYAKHQLTKEQFRDNTVDAAEIGAAETGNALYVVEVNAQGEGPLGVVRIRCKVPATGEFREYEWPVPYNGSAANLEQASPAMRLAASASGFSEWLATSPFAAEVTTDRLLEYLRGVPEVFGADGRARKLEWMIRQAKAIAGR